MKSIAATSESVNRISKTGKQQLEDQLSVEEPLQIELVVGQEPQNTSVENEQIVTISVTMRTPGDDKELATGFLFTEGIIDNASQVINIEHVGEKSGRHQLQNTIRVTLGSDHQLDMKRFQRHFYTHSSCGVCGKTSIDALNMIRHPTLCDDGPVVDAEQLMKLPDLLQNQQNQFQATGAIHAAALFNQSGELICLKEDIGRHNAVDKLIGELLLNSQAYQQQLQQQDLLQQTVLLVSGRVGFELVQKALMANIGFMASVGAPTSLALDCANKFGMTLVGFLKNDRFNIYCGDWRVR